MYSTESKVSNSHRQQETVRNPFFKKIPVDKGYQNFISGSSTPDRFFGGGVQMHPSQKDHLIQRQEQPETPGPKENESGPAQTPLNKPSRAAKCVKDAQFPDFGCFTTQLKLDIDENLINNAHQFTRVATLFPGNNEMMWNTFLRYGLGVNLLETTFSFAGVNKRWGSILSYTAGIGMKAYSFSQNGELTLDIPISLGKDTDLEIKFDLKTDPHNLGNVQGVDTSVGFVRRF